jgi:hypothetical protein
MMKLKALGIGAVMAFAIPALALAVTYTGSFSGYADHDGPGPGVYASGTNYTARMTLDTAQQDPWYPWNAAKEYTAVLSVVVDTYSVFPDVGGPGIDWVVVDFMVASVDVYEDDVTPADYAVPGSFTDGAHILSGQANNMIGEWITVFGNPMAISGDVVFTGGSGFANLLGCAPGGLAMNDYVDFTFATPPTGYEEAYDAEWKCLESVSVDNSTWGNIKSLYR